MRPCVPLCRLLRTGVESLYPSDSFSQRWARMKGDWVRAPYMSLVQGNMEEKQGRKVCRLKGLCCFGQPNPGKHRPAKPCGIVSLNTFWTVWGRLYACRKKTTDTCGKAGDSKVLDEGKMVWQKEKALCGG